MYHALKTFFYFAKEDKKNFKKFFQVLEKQISVKHTAAAEEVSSSDNIAKSVVVNEPVPHYEETNLDLLGLQVRGGSSKVLGRVREKELKEILLQDVQEVAIGGSYRNEAGNHFDVMVIELVGTVEAAELVKRQHCGGKEEIENVQNFVDFVVSNVDRPLSEASEVLAAIFVQPVRDERLFFITPTVFRDDYREGELTAKLKRSGLCISEPCTVGTVLCVLS